MSRLTSFGANELPIHNQSLTCIFLHILYCIETVIPKLAFGMCTQYNKPSCTMELLKPEIRINLLLQNCTFKLFGTKINKKYLHETELDISLYNPAERIPDY